MGDLVAAILARLPPGSVRLNAPAIGLQRGPTSWELSAGGETIRTTAVIIAGPAHVAACLLGSVDPPAASICARVPYASTASVALGFRREHVGHPLRGTGFVVARRHNHLRVTACTWSSSKWESRAPEGYVLLRAFVGGAHDPAAVDLGEDALIEVVLEDLSGVLGITGAPVVTRVFRWRDAAAQHEVGHRTLMAALSERLGNLPGLFVAGSGFEAIGIPDCVAHGRRAAAEAADYAGRLSNLEE
jgi:oxygen-dependent protoporphyrinogen oxidase